VLCILDISSAGLSLSFSDSESAGVGRGFGVTDGNEGDITSTGVSPIDGNLCMCMFPYVFVLDMMLLRLRILLMRNEPAGDKAERLMADSAIGVTLAAFVGVRSVDFRPGNWNSADVCPNDVISFSADVFAVTLAPVATACLNGVGGAGIATGVGASNLPLRRLLVLACDTMYDG
jgi:hypothetical protein